MTSNITFPIGKMPRLAINEVIRSMDTEEQIKLALTSKKMAYYVKMASIKVTWYRIYARNQLSSVSINYPIDATLFCGSQKFKADKKVTRNELSKYCDQGSVTKNMANVFKRVQYFLPGNHIELVLYQNHWKKASIEEVLSNPAFQNYETLYVMNGKIKSKDLKYIMETAKPEIKLALLGTKIHVNFRYVNAFKFRNIQYDDARWVQIEDLYSLCNSLEVTLGKNNFNCSHYNSLIKYWITSKCDMFRELSLELEEETQLVSMFNGVLALHSSRFKRSLHFVAAEPSENRKGTMLFIYGTAGNKLIMIASSPHEFFVRTRKNKRKTMEDEFKITEVMKLLKKKQELENKLMEAEDHDMRNEVEGVIEKLVSLGVYFENGMAMID